MIAHAGVRQVGEERLRAIHRSTQQSPADAHVHQRGYRSPAEPKPCVDRNLASVGKKPLRSGHSSCTSSNGAPRYQACAVANSGAHSRHVDRRKHASQVVVEQPGQLDTEGDLGPAAQQIGQQSRTSREPPPAAARTARPRGSRMPPGTRSCRRSRRPADRGPAAPRPARSPSRAPRSSTRSSRREGCGSRAGRSQQRLAVEVDHMLRVACGHRREHRFAAFAGTDDLRGDHGHDDTGVGVASVLLPQVVGIDCDAVVARVPDRIRRPVRARCVDVPRARRRRRGSS